MDFGFSYVGLLYLAMLFVPNILWSKRRPEGYDDSSEDRRLLALERAGEVAVSVLVLIFSDFDVRTDSLWSLWLLASFAAMVMYELYWMRYFRSARTLADMYSSFAGVPLAGATLPVIGFGLLAVYGLNPFLGAAVLILAVGHIGIHQGHRRELEG